MRLIEKKIKGFWYWVVNLDNINTLTGTTND